MFIFYWELNVGIKVVIFKNFFFYVIVRKVNNRGKKLNKFVLVLYIKIKVRFK